MRSRLPLLALLAVLPVVPLLAAPIPPPSAVLDIGSPPKGKTTVEHCRDIIHILKNPNGFLWCVSFHPEVQKMASVVPMKYACPWLERNLRITEEDGGRRLRLDFRAGTREVQVAVLNTLLRLYMREGVADRIQCNEQALRSVVECRPYGEKLIREERDHNRLRRFQKECHDSKATEIKLRAEIVRLKQITVIKWAK